MVSMWSPLKKLEVPIKFQTKPLKFPVGSLVMFFGSVLSLFLLGIARYWRERLEPRSAEACWPWER